ncbi:hypothetical protein CYLTODRAFT_456901 [Cylindrobasidium torrendii FP15055 ss-10]|uniref:Uncharacterized protein n=1 Tax=Cylindrobasidium torrendii FP15055 ss-10 TaxID=1314674 RepID=A0A0D7B3N5_9AGAR|nr:hypothetical protein CYLTODRAFT_456901 [Cylindrobasidium torrendii FP15055 ss-10]
MSGKNTSPSAGLPVRGGSPMSPVTNHMLPPTRSRGVKRERDEETEPKWDEREHRGGPSPTGPHPQLRDIDLRPRSPSSPFPAPPTGHDLMALFPATAPSPIPPNTSGYFYKQERDFFSSRHFGAPRIEERDAGGHSDRAPRSWPPPEEEARHHHHHHHHHQTHAHHHHSHRSSSHSSSRQAAPSAPYPVDYDTPVEADSDAWKKPTPFNERRRSGKHTRRIVR